MNLTVMTQYAIQRLKAQIPPAPFALDTIQELNTLDVMKKRTDAGGLAQLAQKPFAIMTEGGMTDIMAQGDGFDKILVEMQKSTNGSGNLRNQLDMQNPMGDVIVSNQVKYLRLVDIPSICHGM